MDVRSEKAIIESSVGKEGASDFGGPQLADNSRKISNAKQCSKKKRKCRPSFHFFFREEIEDVLVYQKNALHDKSKAIGGWRLY